MVSFYGYIKQGNLYTLVIEEMSAHIQNHVTFPHVLGKIQRRKGKDGSPPTFWGQNLSGQHYCFSLSQFAYLSCKGALVYWWWKPWCWWPFLIFAALKTLSKLFHTHYFIQDSLVFSTVLCKRWGSIIFLIRRKRWSHWLKEFSRVTDVELNWDPSMAASTTMVFPLHCEKIMVDLCPAVAW